MGLRDVLYVIKDTLYNGFNTTQTASISISNTTRDKRYAVRLTGSTHVQMASDMSSTVHVFHLPPRLFVGHLRWSREHVFHLPPRLYHTVVDVLDGARVCGPPRCPLRGKELNKELTCLCTCPRRCTCLRATYGVGHLRCGPPTVEPRTYPSIFLVHVHLPPCLYPVSLPPCLYHTVVSCQLGGRFRAFSDSGPSQI